MGAVFIDGFDHYSGVVLPEQTLRKKWDNVSTTGIGISGTSPRTGPGKLNVTGSGSFVKKCVPAKATYIAGFAFRRNAGGGGTTFADIFSFQALDFTPQLTVQYRHSSGTLRVTNAAFTSAESAVIDPLNSWVYIEIKCTVGAATGSWTLRVAAPDTAPPAVLLSGANQNTDPAGTGTMEWIQLGTMLLASYDDFYLFDTDGPYPSGGTGPNNDDFVGPCKVYTLWPVGSGPVNNGVGSDGDSVDNHLLVDDNPNAIGVHDGDTTYVRLSNPGEKDLYVPDPNILPAALEVHAVQTTAFARRVGLDAADSRAVIMDSAGGWTHNGEFVVRLPDSSYGIATDVWDRDPNNLTPQSWTKALVESRRYGRQYV
jgi:hypothetical protein